MARKLDSAFIATCSDILDASGERIRHNSPAWPLLDYFSRRCRRLTVLELSVPRPGMVARPQASVFVNGRLHSFKTWGPLATRPFSVQDGDAGPRTYMRLKVRDLLACFWAAALDPRPHDLFIGVESLLALCGGVLKKLGKVRQSVYYISDWSPWKFKNKALNKIYREMDRAACLVSDHIWNYTYAIADARRDILKFDDTHFGSQHWVPFGFIPDGVEIPADEAVDLNRLVFCGGIGPENGLDLVVEALPRIREALPAIRLDVLGDGPDLPRLKARAGELGLGEVIAWHGFVTDRRQILDAQLGSALALAPYAPLETSVKRFGDVIKIREAVGCGLPVITTEVPPSHVEVRDKNLGRVIDFTPTALAEAVTGLLSDPEAYFRVRANVVGASRENLWENIFGRTLVAMGYGPDELDRAPSQRLGSFR
jgi:glycosyltransferase involved in cell wall biosynthesis